MEQYSRHKVMKWFDNGTIFINISSILPNFTIHSYSLHYNESKLTQAGIEHSISVLGGECLNQTAKLPDPFRCTGLNHILPGRARTWFLPRISSAEKLIPPEESNPRNRVPMAMNVLRYRLSTSKRIWQLSCLVMALAS